MKPRYVASAILFGGISLAAVTDEIPLSAFGTYSKTHPFCSAELAKTDKDSCAKGATDTVTVSRVTPNTAKIEVALQCIDAHTCSFDGVGRWDGSALVAEKTDESGKVCEVALLFDSRKVSIDSSCDRQYCGARCGMDRVELPKNER